MSSKFGAICYAGGWELVQRQTGGSRPAGHLADYSDKQLHANVNVQAELHPIDVHNVVDTMTVATSPSFQARYATKAGEWLKMSYQFGTDQVLDRVQDIRTVFGPDTSLQDIFEPQASPLPAPNDRCYKLANPVQVWAKNNYAGETDYAIIWPDQSYGLSTFYSEDRCVGTFIAQEAGQQLA
eukprot:TRINITY_DN12310_c0_g2_i1.p1 TRINITY_DN12310_c0_g2~~TRINITY_DN12310_c0_g2_i1.p1  ORF type:complete len:182 (+),score=23.60 TRINITY_DN12310_c0_g2_i1:1472-2017(+)